MFEEAVSPDAIGLQKTEEMVTKCLHFKELEEKAQEQADGYRNKRTEIERQLQQILEFLGKDKYVGIDGTIEIRKMQSFKTPKTEEQKLAFFGWLREKGIEMQYLNVNSQALNGLLKTEWENAQQEGKELTVPGIEAPTEYSRIYLRKAK